MNRRASKPAFPRRLARYACGHHLGRVAEVAHPFTPLWTGQMWEDDLGTLEVSRTQAAVERLSDEPWAQPLIQRLEEQGWPSVESRSFMFEARFGEALADAAAPSFRWRSGSGVRMCVWPPA